ncbi:MAG: D-alanyl-D-alanine carboxypeptidase/D-alanyl-D-alanine-endopeptidase [Thermonemataceae bacterium]|nr:D-alanyl-D-alanine carboxypeptidase/D-alanyl-D-alanine-endopeptidase [Thermonemataceae bacterium]
MKIIAFIGFFVVWSVYLHAQKNLEQSLNNFQKEMSLTNAQWSLYVQNAENGKVIFEKDSQKTMQVASCQKLFTTAVALEELGKDFTFQTQLAYQGNIEKNTLKGNLIIVGGGDPTLAGRNWLGKSKMNEVFAFWEKALISKNIKKIEGKIIGNASYFPEKDLPKGWSSKDIGNYYASDAYGLNFNDNLYELYLKPAKNVGLEAVISHTSPKIPFLNFKGNITTAEAFTGDNAYISGLPMQNERFLSGTIPLGNIFIIKGALPNPPYTAAYLLHNQLVSRGLAITDKPDFSYEKPSEQLVVITEISSPKLATIIKEVNFFSINLYAEALWKQIGKKNNKSSFELIKEFCQKKNITTEQMILEDGSGLSSENRISTQELGQLLGAMHSSESFSVFYESLPVAANSGTLRSWGKKTPLANNLRAKTGSMQGVIALAGYMRNAKGEKIIVAFAVNAYQGTYSNIRKKMEQVLLAIYRN